MNVHFSQIYIEPGVSFPFSHLFQKRLAKEVSGLAEASPKFLKKYGEDFELTFNVSAKQSLQDNEIRGPSVFKKTKDVEYTVFLPFSVIIRNQDTPKVALRFLLKGVCDVFDLLEIDKTKVLEKKESLIDAICSDPETLAKPSWDKALNDTPGTQLFTAFFESNRSC